MTTCSKQALDARAEALAGLGEEASWEALEAFASTPTKKRHVPSESKIGWSDRSLTKDTPSLRTLVIGTRRGVYVRNALIKL